MPGTIQSDRIENEFSIYRQGSGGNYLISVEEILNTLNLERLKLFSKLEIEQNNEQLNNSSCQCDINDFEDEMSDLVEAAFTVASNLSSNERSILYFISGYVARKENLKSDPNVIKLPESEFTELVSRGKLRYPPLFFMIYRNIYFHFLNKVRVNATQNTSRKAFI